MMNDWDVKRSDRTYIKLNMIVGKRNQSATNHLVDLHEMVDIESSAKRELSSFKTQANQTHFEVGAKVRETIQELGGTMPEDLPKPDKGIPQLARAQKKLEGDK